LKKEKILKYKVDKVAEKKGTADLKNNGPNNLKNNLHND